MGSHFCFKAKLYMDFFHAILSILLIGIVAPKGFLDDCMFLPYMVVLAMALHNLCWLNCRFFEAAATAMYVGFECIVRKNNKHIEIPPVTECPVFWSFSLFLTLLLAALTW